MTRRHGLVLGGVLLALVAGWALFGSRGPLHLDDGPNAAGRITPSAVAAAEADAPPPPVDPATAHPGAQTRPAMTSPAAAHTTSTFPPLPAVDQPFPQIRAQLEAQARAGDADAALRLYGELARCRGYSRTRHPIGDEDDPARRAWRQERTCILQQLCGDDPTVYADPDGRRWDWLAQAAVAGHPVARLAFAEGRMLRDHPRAALRHQALYRQHAVAWTLELAQRGQRNALTRLAMAYADTDGYGEIPLGQLLPQDRERAAVFSLVVALRGNRSTVNALAMVERLSGAPLSDAERAAAHAAAQRWQAQFPPDANLPGETAELPSGLHQLPSLAPRCQSTPEPAPESPTP